MEKVKKTTVKPRLRLVRGKISSRFAVGSVDIVAAPENKPPFRIDAVAYEEDTFLVLSAPLELSEPKEPLERLMTQVKETKPETPGNVLVRGKSPLRFLAIVHDLNQEPSWKEEWIVGALEKIFSEAIDRKLKAIAFPFLGTRHGSLKKERFLFLLRSVLERVTPLYLKRIWLMLPVDGDASKTVKILNPKQRKKKSGLFPSD